MDLRGSRNGGKSSRPAPIRISRESRGIRKAHMPVPVVQYKQPVIIHTYSPKVHQTEASEFMWLVQSLTGSSDTRLRCKKSKKRAVSTSSTGQIPKSSATAPLLESEYKPKPYFHDQKMSTFPSPSASCSSDSGAQTQYKDPSISAIKNSYAISPKSPFFFDTTSLANESSPDLVSSDDQNCEEFLGSTYTSFTSLITSGSEYNCNMNDLSLFSSSPCLVEPLTPSYDSKLFVLQPQCYRDMGWSFYRTENTTYSEV